jgi:nucleotide-binding universal stress UspA family protein
VPEFRGYLLGDARRRLKSLMPERVGNDVTPKVRVAAGAAAEAIRAHAADVKADLIVMGRSKRFMHLGSTAVRILRHTNHALLVVPATAPEQAAAAEHTIHAEAA